jgi:hypothetical protein
MEVIKSSEENMELSCLCKNKKAGSLFCSSRMITAVSRSTTCRRREYGRNQSSQLSVALKLNSLRSLGWNEQALDLEMKFDHTCIQ